MELENRMLYPTVHDDRYDYRDYEEYLYGDEEEEEEKTDGTKTN